MKESNVRNFKKSLAVLSLLAPASAHSLGIGDIKLHSALNQNLNAEISLVLSAGEKISDVKVNLAPPDKYDEAGVPWNYFLSKIKLEPVARPNGAVVIKLSSREALKEPFLGLLLEVSWPKGSLYREFSVIVDPPEVYEQATIPVVTLPERRETAPVLTTAQPETATRPVQSKTRRSYKVTDSYGPTAKNDTLWKIAEQASRQNNVSVEQMMIAIYQENPDAFFKENINALRSGKSLKIPKREVAIKLSRKQALAEYDRQTTAWKNRTTEAPVEVAAADIKDGSVKEEQGQGIDNQLTLVAPSEASVTENAVITPGQEKTTTEMPETQGRDNIADSGKTEAASGNSQGNDPIQNQLAQMQQQLIKMQEIIALKDQQLAALQNMAETQPALQAPGQTPVPALTQPSAQMPASTASQQTEQVSPAVVAPQTPTSAVPTSEGNPVQPVPAEPVKPMVEAAPAQSAMMQQENESDSDSYYLNVGGLGLGLLSVLGWLWWRKRKVDAKTDTESMFASSILSKPAENHALNHSVAPVTVSTQGINDSSGFSVDAVGGSSFLSEFTPSDFDAFDTDQGEIDPISEADVYLAYGRYQQAEDLMRQAIKEQPDRDECKLKLLEIFYANENKRAFEAYADELAMAGKKSDAGFWVKVAEMGYEICPDAALFSSGASQFRATDNTNEKIDPVKLAKKEESKPADIDIIDAPVFNEASFDFDEFLNDDAFPQSVEADSRASDFDLPLIESADNSLGDDSERNNQTLEFDLTSLSSFTTESDSVSFDEDLSENQPKLDKAEGGNDVGAFDFDLDGGNSDISQHDNIGLNATNVKQDDEESFSLDSDFNFDFDLSVDKKQDYSEQNEVFGVSDLTDMDEFETKLDLARAYLDMGDDAAAKEIVEGVLEKGSDEQKRIAQQFFDDIS